MQMHILRPRAGAVRSRLETWTSERSRKWQRGLWAMQMADGDFGGSVRGDIRNFLAWTISKATRWVARAGLHQSMGCVHCLYCGTKESACVCRVSPLLVCHIASAQIGMSAAAVRTATRAGLCVCIMAALLACGATSLESTEMAAQSITGVAQRTCATKLLDPYRHQTRTQGR